MKDVKIGYDKDDLLKFKIGDFYINSDKFNKRIHVTLLDNNFLFTPDAHIACELQCLSSELSETKTIERNKSHLDTYRNLENKYNHMRAEWIFDNHIILFYRDEIIKKVNEYNHKPKYVMIEVTNKNTK